ncbi:hypothetical protein [Amycolatopsis japonica]
MMLSSAAAVPKLPRPIAIASTGANNPTTRSTVERFAASRSVGLVAVV